MMKTWIYALVLPGVKLARTVGRWMRPIAGYLLVALILSCIVSEFVDNSKPPIPRVNNESITNGIRDLLKERAAMHQNAKLVVGELKGTVENTYTDDRWFGDLTVTVGAPFDAQYGYSLDMKANPYRIELQGGQLVVYLQPPELLFDALVKTDNIKIQSRQKTGMRRFAGADEVAWKASRGLTPRATEIARGQVLRSSAARDQAVRVFSDVILDFLGSVHPDLRGYYQNRIIFRIEPDISKPIDLLASK